MKVKSRKEINDFWRDLLRRDSIESNQELNLPPQKVYMVGDLVLIKIGKNKGLKGKVVRSSVLTGSHRLSLLKYRGTIYQWVEFGPYLYNELELTKTFIRERKRKSLIRNKKVTKSRFSKLLRRFRRE